MLESYRKDEETFIRPDEQNRSCEAWQKLLELIDDTHQKKRKKFRPYEQLGRSLWDKITVLPKEIGKLIHVKEMYVGGSQLVRIPPEIGKMESLEIFSPYCSYSLHWFPYEITYCTKMIDSTVSTRALYGNYKYRTNFPDLQDNFVEYHDHKIACSVCNNKKPVNGIFNQVWISLGVGTDVLPLLANICSDTCLKALPNPPADYIQSPHKGGKGEKQPLSEDEIFERDYGKS